MKQWVKQNLGRIRTTLPIRQLACNRLVRSITWQEGVHWRKKIHWFCGNIKWTPSSPRLASSSFLEMLLVGILVDHGLLTMSWTRSWRNTIRLLLKRPRETFKLCFNRWWKFKRLVLYPCQSISFLSPIFHPEQLDRDGFVEATWHLTPNSIGWEADLGNKFC